MNYEIGWDSNGWKCARDQANYSNSNFSGAAYGTASQQTKSKGKPSFKSNTLEVPSNMAWPDPATGNPTKVTNYRQIEKWGNPINGTGGKWQDGASPTEKGYYYEGEIKFRNCINFLMLEVILFLSILIFNKAFESITNSLPLLGFCVNNANYWSNNGWKCDYSQANWSNPLYSGFASSEIQAREVKSKGTAVYKSDASKGASIMGGDVPATGNPVNTSNYSQNLKWGNTIGTKWDALTERPDSQEKGRFYEGGN